MQTYILSGDGRYEGRFGFLGRHYHITLVKFCLCGEEDYICGQHHKGGQTYVLASGIFLRHKHGARSHFKITSTLSWVICILHKDF